MQCQKCRLPCSGKDIFWTPQLHPFNWCALKNQALFPKQKLLFYVEICLQSRNEDKPHQQCLLFRYESATIIDVLERTKFGHIITFWFWMHNKYYDEVMDMQLSLCVTKDSTFGRQCENISQLLMALLQLYWKILHHGKMRHQNVQKIDLKVQLLQN